MNNDSKKIANSEKSKVIKLREIVSKTVEQEKLITENLLHPPEEILTKGQKISDKVASFGGSWAFIISFFIILVVWILYNTMMPVKENLVLYCL